MIEKKTPAYWILNTLSTLQLFLMANLALSSLIMLHANSRPIDLRLARGPLWPIDLLVGSTFPTLFSISAIILATIAALRYRSRWGAATASALATLAFLHLLFTVCLR